ncbi:MAG: protein kinase [Myxococcales bacterium]|nr:protein kinase [Myxococcales bacterium]
MTTVSHSTELRGTLSPGQVVGGRFEIAALARTDALGAVYRASDQKTGRAVAVRLVAADIFPTPETANALREECRTIAKLTHRNLASTYGIGAAAGSQFVAAEWVDGMPLDAFVKDREQNGGAPSLHTIYNIIANVAKGLERLHEAACHGAVSPGTVWISEAGRVQLADVGIACAALKVAGAKAFAADTRGFLAPEIVDGQFPTPESDVYGLGGLLFYLLTKRDPGSGFIPPSMTNPEASPALDDAVLRALERDPRHRFASVAELRRVLQPIASGVQGDLSDDGMDVDVEIGDRVSRVPNRTGASAQPAAVDALPSLPVEIGSVKPAQSGALPSLPVEIDSVKPMPPATPPVAPPVVRAAAGPTPAAERVSIGSPFAPMRAKSAGPTPRQAPAPGAAKPQSAPTAGTPATAHGNDLKGLLAQITENDAMRWMVVKDGLDHGPFSGRDLVQRIVKGEILESHLVANMETGRRGPLGSFELFGPFIEQQRLHKKEAEELVALQKSEKVEKRSRVAVLLIGALVAVGLVVAITLYLDGKGSSDDGGSVEESDNLFNAGNFDIKAKQDRRRTKGRGRAGS